MKRDYEKLMERCKPYIMQKLRENEHKEHWNDRLMIDQMLLLIVEKDELHHEILRYNKYKDNLEAIRLEAADVINFAMFIIDKTLELENE